MILSSISTLALPAKHDAQQHINDYDQSLRPPTISRSLRAKRRQTTPYSSSAPIFVEPPQQYDAGQSLSTTPLQPSIKASPVPSQTLDELEMDNLSLQANFNKPLLDDAALRKKKASRTMSMSDHDFQSFTSHSSIFGSISSTNDSSSSTSSGCQSPQTLPTMSRVMFDVPLTRKTLAPLSRLPSSSLLGSPPPSILAPIQTKGSRRTLSTSPLTPLALGTVQEQ